MHLLNLLLCLKDGVIDSIGILLFKVICMNILLPGASGMGRMRELAAWVAGFRPRTRTGTGAAVIDRGSLGVKFANVAKRSEAN